MRTWLIVLALFVGCASVAPGLLKETIRKNDDRRAYAQCLRQDSRFNAELRYVCRRQSRLRWANWAWEDCINEGVSMCGYRPRFEDIL